MAMGTVILLLILLKLSDIALSIESKTEVEKPLSHLNKDLDQQIWDDI